VSGNLPKNPKWIKNGRFRPNKEIHIKQDPTLKTSFTNGALKITQVIGKNLKMEITFFFNLEFLGSIRDD
jgi:hypothetical protein